MPDRPSSPTPSPLARRARRWGVQTSWVDGFGRRRAVSDASLEAILAALGAADDAPPRDGPIVVTRGAALDVSAGVVVTEGGDQLRIDGRLPADVPLGYHRLLADGGGRERTLIVGPGRCHLPADLRAWGWAVQLYAALSERSWGIGDLGDLGELARWSREIGAGVLLLSPLHFSTPSPPVTPSPYSPGSRRFRDPIHLRIEDVPGAPALGEELETLARRVRPRSAGALIDRDSVLTAKVDALHRIWPSFAGSADFDAWRTAQGDDLDAFATWCALAEVHGPSWPAWPAALRDRRSDAVARERERMHARVEFHVWLQWLIDRQLAEAAAGIPLLIQDLAVGVARAGVDAWLHPELLPRGIHVGAPPDRFNTQGQDWGVLPFDPWRLRSAGYAPFAATLRAGMSGGGLRVDHVMGLSRLFWIPSGGGPEDGAYVRYPSADLFEVVALESVRAGAVVVGEDLGTVEPALRRAMAARDVLSYRLLWFERRPPARWPEHALGAVTTHDLPTVAGLWSGDDLADQLAAGTSPDKAALRGLRRRLQRLGRLRGDASAQEAVEAAYAALAEAPCRLLVATLEDLLAVRRRPNLPGTTADRRPNWSMPLPASVEAIRADPRGRRLSAALRRR